MVRHPGTARTAPARTRTWVPEAVRTAVRNNGGGHWNHTFFWESMGPKKGGDPSGKIGDAIKSAFGDFAKFRLDLAPRESFLIIAGARFDLFRFDGLPAHGDLDQLIRGEHVRPAQK